MWEPWLDGERGSWCSIKSQDHLSGGWMLCVCVCVYHPSVFPIYVLKLCALTRAYITRWRHMTLLPCESNQAFCERVHERKSVCVHVGVEGAAAK